jgi:hypothetical protein
MPYTLDLKILYETLQGHYSQNNGFALDYDYGDASACRSHDFKGECISGIGYLMASPTNIPRIKEFIGSVLTHAKFGDSEGFQIMSSEPHTSNSALESLPSELFCAVLESLDHDSICAVRVASKATLNQTSYNGFWRKKAFADMAWAAEFLPSRPDACSSQTDWFKVYKVMRAISQGQYRRCLPTSWALRNRSRVWGVCSSFVEEYCVRKAVYEQQQSNRYAVLHGADETSLRLLRYPIIRSVILSEIGLIRSFADTRSAQPVISIFWSKIGELAGIGTKMSGDEDRNCIGSKNTFATSDDVQIPKDGWITELVIITRGEIDVDNLDMHRRVVGLEFFFSKGDPICVGEAKGDKRAVFPEPGHFVVGFKLAFPMGQPIAKLGLLFQPIEKAPQDSLHRLELPILRDDTGIPVETDNPEIGGRLWKTELPPRVLDILPARTGYGRPSSEKDDYLMEALIFGSKEQDLKTITAIGVDPLLRGFEVCLDDGNEKTTRSIGNTNAMHYLPIDGRGGERILCCYVKINDRPEGIRFVTNRGRQLIVGRTNKYNEVSFPHDEKSILMGIYCHWSNRNTCGTNLSSVGAFSRKVQGIPVKLPALVQDEQKRSWMPSAPPALCRVLSSSIHGQWQFKTKYDRIRHVPSEDAVLSWLDCSRPLKSITVGKCHNFESDQLPLVSISFRYSDDQTTASVGPTKFSSRKDLKCMSINCKNYYSCWCRDRELKGDPHFTQEEWKVGRLLLKSVQLWINSKGTLTGLQFTDNNDQTSPPWGYCKTGNPLRLSLQANEEGWGAGLKFFIDEVTRGVVHEDRAIVAVQLMALHKG